MTLPLDALPIGVRCHTEPATKLLRRPRRAARDLPGLVLVLDVNALLDASQRFTFGCARFYGTTRDALVLRDEYLIYADDLPDTDPEGHRALSAYPDTHWAPTGRRRRRIRPISRSKFVERVLFPLAASGAAILGFDMAYMLSRPAIGSAKDGGRDQNYGAHSLIFGAPGDPTRFTENRYLPRVNLRSIDANRTIISMTTPLRDPDDNCPPERGRFIDLGTLGFALTGQAHSLSSAAVAFGLTSDPLAPLKHRDVTEAAIDACREGVDLAARLYQAMAAEYARHAIPLAIEHAMSAATMAKGYLAAMNITPPLDRQAGFDPEVLGYAMCAFYGGRSECKIRHTPVPVAVVDFTSMYPTVVALMDLWRHFTATRIDPVEVTDEIQHLLDTITADACFDPSLWPQLVGLVQLQPGGHRLPARARYDGATYTTGVNPVWPPEPLWYTIADAIAATLLTGRAPRVLRAIRFLPGPAQRSMRAVKLRGRIPVDPNTDDLFGVAVEERQRIKTAGHAGADDAADDVFLKILANSGSYGIHVELRETHHDKRHRTHLTVYGQDGAYPDRIRNPEVAGPWYFPPTAAALCGGARLMLALLEHHVTALGGTWAYADTDSMAIVADTEPALVPCAGGPHTTDDGRPAVRALALEQVDGIRDRFAALNPYDPASVPGERILKLETVARCYAVSAKRYVLYQLDDTGRPYVEADAKMYKSHGLGHLLNPIDPANNDSDWIRQHWERRVLIAHGYPAPEQAWLDQPTLSKTTITSPDMLRAFGRYNADRPYAEQVKPFNRVMYAPGARPPDVTRGACRLVAPFEPDPDRWPGMAWTNLRDPHRRPYRLSTDWTHPTAAKIDDYRSFLERHHAKPEAKALAPDGTPCAGDTAGLLSWRPILATTITHLGKESNRLDERADGLLDTDDEPSYQTIYPACDPNRAAWLLCRRVLNHMSARERADIEGISSRQLNRLRSGTSTAPTSLYPVIAVGVAKWAAAQIGEHASGWTNVGALFATFLADKGDGSGPTDEGDAVPTRSADEHEEGAGPGQRPS